VLEQRPVGGRHALQLLAHAQLALQQLAALLLQLLHARGVRQSLVGGELALCARRG